MAIICRKYNLLFIMTPRTACTAIGELLCNHYDGEFLPPEDILDSNGMISVQKKHTTLAELIRHGILAPDEAKSLLKVAAVRHPFDSLVSLYLKQRFKYRPLLGDQTSWVHRSPRYAEYMKYAQTHSFNQWVLKVCYRKVIKKLLGLPCSMFAEHTQDMDVVLRYESIQKDLKDAFNRAGIGWKADIPKLNRTEERSDPDYRSYYSWPAALVVKIAYWDDLKRYRYKF